MKKNRLNLNFNLETNTERSAFVQEYLQSDEFIKRPPTADESETIANYILYGRDAETGLNVVQSKSVQISSKHGTWDNTHADESLDALMESPLFNESQISSVSVHYTKKNEKFSRQDALNAASPEIQLVFKDLFKRIDQLDFEINQYELINGKRTEVREKLAAKFSSEETAAVRNKVLNWTQYYYSKQRHNLVELRREQYTLRDYVKNTILPHGAAAVQIPITYQWDSDINVLPLGLKTDLNSLVFREKDLMHPQAYTEDQLKQVSDYYWQIQDKPKTQLEFDFRDLENVYQLFLIYFELEDGTIDCDVENNTAALLDTLNYYIDFAELSELQKDILSQKMRKIKNSDIAWDINKKYGKNYTVNYISTIFRQKIIPLINTAANEHFKIVGNLWFSEEFKTCSCCGRTYLRTSDYFIRKARSHDGLNSKCKKCEKIERNEKKVIKNG